MWIRGSLFRATAAEIAQEIDAEWEDDSAAKYRPRYNVAPTQKHWIVGLDQFGLQCILGRQWGFERAVERQPFEDNRRMRLVTDVEMETAWATESLLENVRSHRCVVLFSGFYAPHGQASTPRIVHFTHAAGALLMVAGICDRATPTGNIFRVSILTAPSSLVPTPSHHRLPVLLDADRIDEWLSADAGSFSKSRGTQVRFF